MNYVLGEELGLFVPMKKGASIYKLVAVPVKEDNKKATSKEVYSDGQSINNIQNR